MGLAELAVLSVPTLVAIRPIMKSFNIFGLGVDFKEMQAKAVKEAKDLTVVLHIGGESGAKTGQASAEAERGEIADLPLA
jgi:hypothetical protein